MVVSDPLLTPSSNTCASVAPGATCTLTGDYVVPQADLDAGSFTNTATADSDQTATVDHSETVNFTQAPAMTVLKSVTSTGPYVLGDTITYSIVATNTGNVTLTNVVVSDPLLTPSSNTCASVAPGATCTLTGDYVVTQADLDAGSFTNTATADSDQTAHCG